VEVKNFVQEYIDKLRRAFSELDPESLAQAVLCLREAGRNGQMIYSCGNGGSALIASQMVVDMVKGASRDGQPRFKMLGLADNMGTLSAYGNDVSFEAVFVEPLKNFAEKGDVLLAISGSGNSPNVLRAVEYANSIGCKTIGLTTAMGGRLKEIVQLPLLVPASHMGRLEDCFFAMTHILCYAFIEGIADVSGN
jgi:D-sedoheptulose 7-phosphate isomerase